MTTPTTQARVTDTVDPVVLRPLVSRGERALVRLAYGKPPDFYVPEWRVREILGRKVPAQNAELTGCKQPEKGQA